MTAPRAPGTQNNDTVTRQQLGYPANQESEMSLNASTVTGGFAISETQSLIPLKLFLVVLYALLLKISPEKMLLLT